MAEIWAAELLMQKSSGESTKQMQRLRCLRPKPMLPETKYSPNLSIQSFNSRARGKSTLRILHADLAARGLGATEEHVQFQPDRTLDVVMKLLQTLALWKKEGGRPVPIKIQPDHLARQFDENRHDRCEYELLLDGSVSAQTARKTILWPEPGAAYVHVPNYIEGAKVRVRLTVNGENWRSPFVLPQMGGVDLTKDGATP